jgi:selenide, water dikinase
VIALNLLCWPRDVLPYDLAAEVLRGGLAVADLAGCHVAGGHSVDDPEPKYGMAITGVIHPDRVLRNRGARPGDALVLTKRIGTGLVSTAIKRGLADRSVRDAAVASMIELNARAGNAAVEAGASAATDVTGFGLLGHLKEMLGKAVGVEIDSADVPLLPGARGFAERGVVAGGTRRNLGHAGGFTDFGDTDDDTRVLLADAQTSGGLLVALSPDRVGPFTDAFGGEVWTIGRFTEDHPGRIRVAE